MNLKQSFDKLDDNLKLDPRERQRAIDLHTRLGEILIAAGIAKRTKLQGSFARKTMRPPLKDVDKIIELTDELAAQLDSPGGAFKALVLIKDSVEDAFPGATFEFKKHALGMVLPGESFDFDAVPAINDEDGTGWIRIADSEDDRWEPSNTYVLIETVATRNLKCGGCFIRQVRMVKQACREAGIDLPGLHLESFAYLAITHEMSHDDAVAATLDAAVTALAGSYTEPTGVDRIDQRLKPGQREDALVKMQRLAANAAEAQRRSKAGDETGACKIWAGIFGEPFPNSAGAKTILASLNAGQTLTSTGTVTPTVATPRLRPWRP